MRKIILIFLFVFLYTVNVQAEESSQELEQSWEILEDLELDKIQESMEDLLGQEKVSIQDMMSSLMNGEDAVDENQWKELLSNAILGQLKQQKTVIFEVLLLILVAAIFTNFTNIFESAQIAEVSFYVVYMLLFAILVQAFGTLSSQLKDTMTTMIQFMQVLSPSYYIAIAASTGITSATMYYEMTLLAILCVQWVMIVIVLPAVNIYILLELVNHLSKEEFLSKMTELIKTLIDWCLKTIISLMVGLQVIRGLIAPVIDSLKRTIIGKTASAIPGVGNAIDSVTEIVLGSAALVRNSLGVVALIIFVFACITPLIKYAGTSLVYKLLAASAQPISDKRMVACLSTMGEGCSLLMKVLFSTQLLFMITIIIMIVTFR